MIKQKLKLIFIIVRLTKKKKKIQKTIHMYT